VIKNLITRDEIGYTQHFRKNIFITFKTFLLDNTYADLNLPKTHLYTVVATYRIEEIMSCSKKKKNGVLILIDDIISDAKFFTKKQSNLLTTLFYMGRHYGSCRIITSQKYRSIPSGMMSNASTMIRLRLKK